MDIRKIRLHTSIVAKSILKILLKALYNDLRRQSEQKHDYSGLAAHCIGQLEHERRQGFISEQTYQAKMKILETRFR